MESITKMQIGIDSFVEISLDRSDGGAPDQAQHADLKKSFTSLVVSLLGHHGRNRTPRSSIRHRRLPLPFSISRSRFSA
jgi:hypothetical protein